ncbi:MAG: DUF6320 domain-containing protein [Bacillota bacterium]
MKCVHCGVTIAGRSEVCPLCHANLAVSGTTSDRELRSLPKAFPTRATSKLLMTNVFDKVYILVASIIVAILAIVELVIFKRVHYVLLVFAGAIYFYFLIRSTLHNSKHFSQKVMAQALFISIFCVLIQALFDFDNVFVFEYGLPVLYIIALIAEGVNLIIHIKRPRIHLMTLIATAFLSTVPTIVVNAIIKQPLDTNLLPIIVGGVGAIVGLLTIILWFRRVLEELQRWFHI